jgi:hypothetical protein
MRYILYLLVFAVLATGLTSCESDSTSSSSTTKELEVTPSKTSVGVYETFSIKARMTNTPLSDVMLYIDFGDGVKKGHIMAGDVTYHKYGTIGTYTITVTAVDEYTQDTLATKSIQIIVSDVIPVVAFTRGLIDTTVQNDYEGRLVRISFPFTANAPISKVDYQFGDGNTLTVSDGGIRSYYYLSPGTHRVIIDVYNDKGDYWASDTMTCIIRLPDVTLDMLTSAYNVGVALVFDSTSSIYPSLKPYAYLQAGIGNRYDSVKKVTWTGSSFNVHIAYDTRTDFKIAGTISSDLKTIETMTVSFFDSISTNMLLKYGYTLSNLELCGMNNEVVIYRAAYRSLSTFTSDEYFEAKNYPYESKRIGDISSMIDNTARLYIPAPYAYVVFTRK